MPLSKCTRSYWEQYWGRRFPSLIRPQLVCVSFLHLTSSFLKISNHSLILGRILARFSGDLEEVDDELPYVLTEWLDCFMEVKKSIHRKIDEDFSLFWEITQRFYVSLWFGFRSKFLFLQIKCVTVPPQFFCANNSVCF